MDREFKPVEIEVIRLAEIDVITCSETTPTSTGSNLPIDDE